MSFNEFMHGVETIALIIMGLVVLGIVGHFQWLYVKPPGVPEIDIVVIKWVTLLVGIGSFWLACLPKQRAQGLGL